MALKYLTSSKSVKFPSCHATTKNVTKLAWWLCETLSKNTTNQGNRGGIVVLVVNLKRAASEVVYLRWFLCGGPVSGGAAEIIMVGES